MFYERFCVPHTGNLSVVLSNRWVTVIPVQCGIVFLETRGEFGRMNFNRVCRREMKGVERVG